MTEAQTGRPGAFRQRMAIFRNRSFTFFFTGQFISRIGDGLFLLAMVWMMHSLTNSALQMSLVLIANLIPRIFLNPFSGALADRWRKQRTMISTDLIRAVLLGLLGTLTLMGTATPLVLILFSFVLSIFTTLFSTSYMVMQRRIVDSDQLLQANSLQQTSQTLAAIIGPAIAGVLIGIMGTGPAFLIDGASFILSALTLVFVHVEEPERSKKPLTAGTLVQDVKAGAKIVFSYPSLRVLLPSMLLFNFFIIALENLLLVQFVANVLHRGSTIVGLMEASGALGALVGGLFLSLVTTRLDSDRLLIACLVVTAVSIALVGLFREIWLVAFLLFIGALAMSFVNITFFTGIQKAVPSEKLGTVFGMLGTVFNAVTPLSQLVFGGLATWFAADHLITAMGVLGTLAALVSLFNPELRKRKVVPTEVPVDTN